MVGGFGIFVVIFRFLYNLMYVDDVYGVFFKVGVFCIVYNLNNNLGYFCFYVRIGLSVEVFFLKGLLKIVWL